MTDFLKILGIYSSFLIGVGTFVVFLSKTIINLYLNKDLEKFKAQLLHENQTAKLQLDKEIASFTGSINLIYSKQLQLYSKKTEKIEKLYQKLVGFNFAMLDLTKQIRLIGSPSLEARATEDIERINIASKKGNDFILFYSSNKIYFSEETCDLVEKIKSELLSSHSEYSLNHLLNLPKDDDYFKKLDIANKKVNIDILPLLKKLEDDFRLTLGVIEHTISLTNNK